MFWLEQLLDPVQENDEDAHVSTIKNAQAAMRAHIMIHNTHMRAL